MKIPKLKNNIGYLFVTYILLFSTFAALLSTAAQLFFEYNQDINRIKKSAEQIEKSHKATIIKALWSFDVSILEAQLKGIKNFPDVRYAGILKDKKIILETGEKTVEEKYLLYQFPLVHSPQNYPLQIGTLKVKISLSAVYQRLRNRIVFILFTQTLKTLFVSIFIFFLFYFIVGRHLNTLAAFARSVHLKNLEKPLILNRKNNALDELGLVESAINSMRQKLLHEMDNVLMSKNLLKESEERYKSLVSNIPGVVYRRKLRPIWKMEYISDPIIKICGYQAQDFFNGNINFTQLIHRKDAAKASNTVRTYVEEGKPFEIEYRMLHKNGGIRFVIEKGRAVYGKEDQPLWVDGVILDITEKVETEQRLKEKDLLLSSIIDSTTDAVFLKDTDGKYLMANAAALKAFGLAETEVIGRTDAELFPRESAERISRSDAAVISTGKSLIREEKLETAYGETYWQSNKNILRDAEGGIAGIIGISRNITEFKRIQEQNVDLERKLMQAQKLESIGNLSGGIAHDFNNILFPIVGMSELLLEDLSPDTQEYEKVQNILQAGTRAAELVKQILAFSRKSESRLVPVCVQEIIKEVLHLCKASIPAYIEIDHDIQHDCASVMADPTKIHQIAMNLITNAFHAMESEGGKIIVTLKEITPESGEPVPAGMSAEGCIKLSVADTGYGIPPDVLDRIFDPYFTTKEQGKGTGLGLSVVYGIIKSLNGEIMVHSEPGKGAVFDIYLPAADDTPAIEAEDSKGVRAAGNEHILLVDDEASVALLEKKILERLGYRVTSCSGSLEAFDIFQSSPDSIDIVLTDMNMPKMTGDILAGKLLAVRPDIPIIICTGFSERMDEGASASLGIKGFLMKPASKDELAEIVRKVLDESKGDPL